MENWESFEGKIQEEYDALKEMKEKNPTYISDPLFRVQGDAAWKLETTLERFTRDKQTNLQEWSWEDYWEVMGLIQPAINSLSDIKHSLP